jgi:hypothetical protein
MHQANRSGSWTKSKAPHRRSEVCDRKNVLKENALGIDVCREINYYCGKLITIIGRGDKEDDDSNH